MNNFGKILLLGALSTSVLVGCSNERGDLISQAKSAYGNGDYETALQSLSGAKSLKNFTEDETEIADLHTETLTKVFERFKQEGDAEYNQRNYEKSLELFLKAQELISTDVHVNTQISNSKYMFAMQDDFDKYGNLIVEVLNESNDILRKFSKNLDSLKVGVVSEKEFIVSIKGLIPKSNEIVAKIDDAFYTIDETIVPIHQQLIDLIDYQHRTLLNAVDVSDFVDPVESLRNDYLSIKKEQTNLISEMKNFAKERNIVFNVTPTPLEKTNSPKDE